MGHTRYGHLDRVGNPAVEHVHLGGRDHKCRLRNRDGGRVELVRLDVAIGTLVANQPFEVHVSEAHATGRDAKLAHAIGTNGQAFHAFVSQQGRITSIPLVAVDKNVWCVGRVVGRQQHIGSERVSAKDVVGFWHHEGHQVGELVGLGLNAAEQPRQHVFLCVLHVDDHLGHQRHHRCEGNIKEVGGFPQHFFTIFHLVLKRETLIELNLDVFGQLARLALAVHELDLFEVIAVSLQVFAKRGSTPRIVFVKLRVLRFRTHHEGGEFLVLVFLLDQGQVDGGVHPRFVLTDEVDKVVGHGIVVLAFRLGHAAPLELGDVVDQIVTAFANVAGLVHEGTDLFFVLGILDLQGGQCLSNLAFQRVLGVLQAVLHFHEAVEDFFGDVQGQKRSQDEVHHPDHLLTWCFFSSGHGSGLSCDRHPWRSTCCRRPC